MPPKIEPLAPAPTKHTLFDLSLSDDIAQIEQIYSRYEVISSELVLLPFREIIWREKPRT